MKEYGKWAHKGRWDFQRPVKSWVFGFVRETVQRWSAPAFLEYDWDRMLRILNREMEPEVKLDDRRTYSAFGAMSFIQGDYRFSTEALKAELERREKEPKPSTIFGDWGGVITWNGGPSTPKRSAKKAKKRTKKR